MASTGFRAISQVTMIIVEHEIGATEGELISNVWDRWMERHPILTAILTFVGAAVIAAHLTNTFERVGLERYDPFSGFGYPLLQRLRGV